MDLSLKGPPFNPLQEATVYQALQCFADCLSCLSLKKKKQKTLCTYTCAQALSVSVSVEGEKAGCPTACRTSSRGLPCIHGSAPNSASHSHPVREG